MKGLHVTLIRREFWENKMLWFVPLGAAVLLIGGAVFGDFGQLEYLHVDPRDMGSQVLSTASLISTTSFIGAITGLVLFAYLLESLNSERRDRSILFWKSLPVSDAKTVLSKVVTAVLVVPLGAILLIFLIQPIFMLINWVRFESVRQYISFDMLAAWPIMLARIGLMWVFCVLWYAPLCTWLMLTSVLARRAPLAYAALPPLALIALDRLMLPSSGIAQFVVGRFFPWGTHLNHLTGEPGNMAISRYAAGRWWTPFQDPALWIGLAVAAGMLYIVIRLRRYRDDT